MGSRKGPFLGARFEASSSDEETSSNYSGDWGGANDASHGLRHNSRFDGDQELVSLSAAPKKALHPRIYNVFAAIPEEAQRVEGQDVLKGAAYPGVNADGDRTNKKKRVKGDQKKDKEPVPERGTQAYIEYLEKKLSNMAMRAAKEEEPITANNYKLLLEDYAKKTLEVEAQKKGKIRRKRIEKELFGRQWLKGFDAFKLRFEARQKEEIAKRERGFTTRTERGSQAEKRRILREQKLKKAEQKDAAVINKAAVAMKAPVEDLKKITDAQKGKDIAPPVKKKAPKLKSRLAWGAVVSDEPTLEITEEQQQVLEEDLLQLEKRQKEREREREREKKDGSPTKTNERKQRVETETPEDKEARPIKDGLGHQRDSRKRNGVTFEQEFQESSSQSSSDRETEDTLSATADEEEPSESKEVSRENNPVHQAMTWLQDVMSATPAGGGQLSVSGAARWQFVRLLRILVHMIMRDTRLQEWQKVELLASVREIEDVVFDSDQTTVANSGGAGFGVRWFTNDKGNGAGKEGGVSVEALKAPAGKMQQHIAHVEKVCQNMESVSYKERWNCARIVRRILQVLSKYTTTTPSASNDINSKQKESNVTHLNTLYRHLFLGDWKPASGEALLDIQLPIDYERRIQTLTSVASTLFVHTFAKPIPAWARKQKPLREPSEGEGNDGEVDEGVEGDQSKEDVLGIGLGPKKKKKKKTNQAWFFAESKTDFEKAKAKAESATSAQLKSLVEEEAEIQQRMEEAALAQRKISNKKPKVKPDKKFALIADKEADKYVKRVLNRHEIAEKTRQNIENMRKKQEKEATQKDPVKAFKVSKKTARLAEKGEKKMREYLLKMEEEQKKRANEKAKTSSPSRSKSSKSPTSGDKSDTTKQSNKGRTKKARVDSSGEL